MFDPDWLDGKAPYAAHLITWLVVGLFAHGARADVDKAIAAAHRLPVVESRLADQGRRIERLELMDAKLDRLAENMAAVMQEVKRK